jgi:hypothetical protein
MCTRQQNDVYSVIKLNWELEFNTDTISKSGTR